VLIDISGPIPGWASGSGIADRNRIAGNVSVFSAAWTEEEKVEFVGVSNYNIV
jgi:hypothetical protein